MLQDSNKGNSPKISPDNITDAGSKAVGNLANKVVNEAANQVGGKVKEVNDQVQQAQQLAEQASELAEDAQRIRSTIPYAPGSHYGLGLDFPKPRPAKPNPGVNKASNSQLITENEVMGVSHLVHLTIMVEGRRINSYKAFSLSQSATKHHQFKLILDHDSLGKPEDHYMENAQQLLGKRILVTFTYKNIPEGPIRDFIGVITKVGLSRENRNHGNIEVSGQSPTILLDGAPHIQSFGGSDIISLNGIVHRVLEQGLGSGKYPVAIDSRYDNVAYSCQYEESHYNYLARLAETYGEQFYYDGETVRFGMLPFYEKAIELIFGKNVDQVDIAMKALHVNPRFYGYCSSDNMKFDTNPSTIKHASSLGKSAYSISQATYTAPSLRVAPIKARTSKDVDAAQDSTAGSSAVSTFTTSGRTSVPFLYPGCVVDMQMMKPGDKKSYYFTRLMIIEINHSVDKLGNYEGHFEAIGSDTGYLPRPEFQVPKAETQIATVIDNEDDIGRIQVRFDWQTDGDCTEWIRVMTPDAGSSDKVSKNRGFVFIPEVGDQVMVGFMHSHPDRPYVMGGLFHGQSTQGGGKGNNIKSLSSKSGNKLELNDKAGSVYLTDRGGVNMKFDGGGNATTNANSNHTVNAGSSNIVNVGGRKDAPPQAILKMDDAGNIILDGKTSITFQVGGNKIVIDGSGITGSVAEGDISFDATAGTFSIHSSDKMDVSTDADLEINSETSKIASSGSTAINGADVEINKA